MRVMVVSDVHYSPFPFKGVDESGAFEWLAGIVDRERPDLLVGLGDWGEDAGFREFDLILDRVRLWTIYGNHDNVPLLRMLRNRVPDARGERVLFRDGEVRFLGGVGFGGVNGIVALRRRSRGGVPRKSPEEFVGSAVLARSRGASVLMMHPSPWLPLPEYRKIRRGPETMVVNEALERARPALALCGHLDLETGYTLYTMEWGGVCLRIDSSQLSRHYAVLEVGEEAIEITVKDDGEEVDRGRVVLPGRQY